VSILFSTEDILLQRIVSENNFHYMLKKRLDQPMMSHFGTGIWGVEFKGEDGCELYDRVLQLDRNS